jgi:hypothetical protein
MIHLAMQTYSSLDSQMVIAFRSFSFLDLYSAQARLDRGF